MPVDLSPDLPLHVPLPSTRNLTFIGNGNIRSNTTASNDVTVLGNIMVGMRKVREDPVLNLNGTTNPQSIYLDYHLTRDPYQRPISIGIYMINEVDNIKSSGWAHTKETWGEWDIDTSFKPCHFPSTATSFDWSQVTLNFMDAAKLIADERRKQRRPIPRWKRIVCEQIWFNTGELSWSFINADGLRDRVGISDKSVTLAFA